MIWYIDLFTYFDIFLLKIYLVHLIFFVQLYDIATEALNYIKKTLYMY